MGKKRATTDLWLARMVAVLAIIRQVIWIADRVL